MMMLNNKKKNNQISYSWYSESVNLFIEWSIKLFLLCATTIVTIEYGKLTWYGFIAFFICFLLILSGFRRKLYVKEHGFWFRAIIPCNSFGIRFDEIEQVTKSGREFTISARGVDRHFVLKKNDIATFLNTLGDNNIIVRTTNKKIYE